MEVYRVLVWRYTAGGFVDECGQHHASGLHYQWTHLSVLNENEHWMLPAHGPEYTVCFDAWKQPWPQETHASTAKACRGAEVYRLLRNCLVRHPGGTESELTCLKIFRKADCHHI